MSEDNTTNDIDELEQNETDDKPKVIKNLKGGTAKLGAALGTLGSQIATATKNVNEKLHVTEHAKGAGSKMGSWVSAAAHKTAKVTISMKDKAVHLKSRESIKNNASVSTSPEKCGQTHTVFMETVSAPTNIACIKYWGKANHIYNTPINSSVSVTLDQSDLCAVTTAAASHSFTSDRLWLNGVEDESASSKKRFRACIDGVKKLASDRIDPVTKEVLVKKEEWKDMFIHVSSYNTFPTAAGLASSAAGYAALVYALAKLFCAVETYPGELSTIARQGSGSACRSMYGGLVAWRMGGSKDDCSDSIAEQVAPEDHWPEIRALILVVSDSEKEISSTLGMDTSVATSELLEFRAQHVVPQRMRVLEQAWLERDFETFGKITMMDSNQFHATCLDTYPPIFYLNDISKSIIKLVHTYNAWVGQVKVAYTFDAGPNAVLYTLEDSVEQVCALLLKFFPELDDDYISDPVFAEKIKTVELDEALVAEVAKSLNTVINPGDVKKIYVTRVGSGPQSLGPERALIDPVTGLNDLVSIVDC